MPQPSHKYLSFPRRRGSRCLLSRAAILSLAVLFLSAYVCCAASPSYGSTPHDRARAADLAHLLFRAYPGLEKLYHAQPVPGANGYYLTSPGGGPDAVPLLAAILVKNPPENMTFPVTVADSLAQPYPKGNGGRRPAESFDPGRTRCLPLLRALYGGDEKAVRANCESVDFLGQRVMFNRRFGAAAALKRVAERLKKHLATHPEDAAYILPLAGTFAWRPVKGTGQLSAHAFGVAIDLNAQKGLYWQWKPDAAQVEATRNDYPQAIVAAFEAEGFIWGGKWSAFDFMHFEYRPELLLPAP